MLLSTTKPREYSTPFGSLAATHMEGFFFFFYFPPYSSGSILYSSLNWVLARCWSYLARMCFFNKSSSSTKGANLNNFIDISYVPFLALFGTLYLIINFFCSPYYSTFRFIYVWIVVRMSFKLRFRVVNRWSSVSFVFNNCLHRTQKCVPSSKHQSCNENASWIQHHESQGESFVLEDAILLTHATNMLKKENSE